MVQTRIHEFSAPLKNILPLSIWRWTRAIGTAVITPLRFSIQTGHFKSSLLSRSVSSSGHPLPWYTYPAINFLQQRDFTNSRILEFGGGQSTFWWSARASSVCTIEEDLEWFNRIKSGSCDKVTLKHIPIEADDPHLNNIRTFLSGTYSEKFDVIIVDGHKRSEATRLALEWVCDNGAIILDDSHGYGYREVIKDLKFQKIDFYGFAPGVNLPKCTSIIYSGDCFLLDPSIKIPGTVF